MYYSSQMLCEPEFTWPHIKMKQKRNVSTINTFFIFSCFGGLSRECNGFFSHAAEQIATKRKILKHLVVSWMKSRLNFALLRSCLLCIRGTRTTTNFNAINGVKKRPNLMWPAMRLDVGFFTYQITNIMEITLYLNLTLDIVSIISHQYY